MSVDTSPNPNGAATEPTFEEQPMPASLSLAKLQVMRRCPYIKKRKGEAGTLKYTYLAEADLVAKLHEEMTLAGLTVNGKSMTMLDRREYQTAKGSTMMNIVIACEYTMRHVSGETETGFGIGEASDSGDKSAAKAQTLAYKYFLRQSFLIETGDDPDEDNEDKARVASEESFKSCLKALVNAPDEAKLDAYIHTYTYERNYSGQHRAELDRASDARREELKKQKAGSK